MRFTRDDGGRAAAGFKGSAGDCVTRAIAIATGKPYREVYDALAARIKEFAKGRSRRARHAAKGGATPRNGVHREVYQAYLESLGWTWVPTMKVGQGCRTHLAAGDLPDGRIIVRVSKHICAVVDGVLRDTHNCARAGSRCVYGYFRPAPVREGGVTVLPVSHGPAVPPAEVVAPPAAPVPEPTGPAVYIERRLGGTLTRLDRRPRYCGPHRATGLRGSTGETEWTEPEKVMGDSYHTPKGGVVDDIRRPTPATAAALAEVAAERERLRLAQSALNRRERELLAADWPNARPLTVAELKGG